MPRSAPNRRLRLSRPASPLGDVNTLIRSNAASNHRSLRGSVQKDFTTVDSEVAEELDLAAHVADHTGPLSSDPNDPPNLGQRADITAISQDPPIDAAQHNLAGVEAEGISEVYHKSDPTLSGRSSTPHGGEAPTDELAVLRKKCGRFRILVLGRANAGKTTLLRAVCGTKGDPQILGRPSSEDEPARADVLAPTAERGIHDIRTQLVFPSNSGFIFHDSQGFEAGSDEELQAVMTFIKDRAGGKSLGEQLHAIWYCIPTDNEARMLSGPEKELLASCITGPVPLVVIFTKFDSLEAGAFQKLKNKGLTRSEARAQAVEQADKQFRTTHLPHVFGEETPSYICLRKMHRAPDNHEVQAMMAELIQKTVDTVDVDSLKLLLVSVQQNNLQLAVKYAVEHGYKELVTSTVTRHAMTEGDLTALLKELLNGFSFIKYNGADLEEPELFPVLRDVRGGDWGWLGGVDGDGERLNLKERIIQSFHSAISPNLHLLVGPLSAPLQMHAIAIGILIVVCQLFWLTNGKRPSLEIIQQYTEQYCTSDTPDAVKGALMAVFPATSGTLKDEDCDLILQIVLDNMGNHPAAKPSE